MRSPSFRILLPENNRPERDYVCRYVFEERLGLPCSVERGTVTHTEIQQAGKRLIIPDVLFAGDDGGYLSEGRLPAASTSRLSASPLNDAGQEPDVVALFPLPGVSSVAEVDETTVRLSVDVLGDIFFMLSRMEEAIVPSRDRHGRFPTEASWAVRNGVEQRPIADEAIELLRQCCEMLWPGAVRPRRGYRLAPSHDIDHPFLYHGLPTTQQLARVVRKVGGDMAIRRSSMEAVRSVAGFVSYQRQGVTGDPYFTVRKLMAESEQRGLQSTFYLIVRPELPIDGRAYVDDPEISKTVREVVERGHRLGLHASYGCYADPDRAKEEVSVFRRFLDRHGVPADGVGVRQHYLRWSPLGHWAMWNASGMTYDATLGYGDRVGFRCGTSHEYPVFDLAQRRALALREKPLLVMDSAICPDAHARPALLLNQMRTVMTAIARRCRRYGGTLELLWHNTHLQTRLQETIYRDLLDLCVGA